MAGIRKGPPSAEHVEMSEAVLVRDPALACDLTARHFAQSAETLAEMNLGQLPAEPGGRRPRSMKESR